MPASFRNAGPTGAPLYSVVPESQPLDAFDDLDERGLARAVRSEQAEADALLDREADVVHGPHAGVGLDEIC